ncbi:MAG: hypothetical protein H6624_00765 [Bdellovibrionaceae bacterium]|nr:hypothetical protein [Bdellovibrionales bacterium]MCB9082840.1 hypothetical protein [Pseudobdellovibrionaceae bacterium]
MGASSAWAIDKGAKYQVHLRAGLMQGTYSGSNVEGRTFSVPTTLDVELEVFRGRDESFTTRAIMAMELGDNRVNYTYAGVGRTYYLWSRGRKDVRKEKFVQIANIPKTRYYWSWNGGIAQVLAIPFGLVLATYSTTLDLSVAGGMIYQVTPNLGLEFQMGTGLGYGFSTVTVTGVTVRALFGVTYFL